MYHHFSNMLCYYIFISFETLQVFAVIPPYKPIQVALQSII